MCVTMQRIHLMARLVLGALLIYMGASKAFEPVEFLKLMRQYDVLQHHFLLNFVAATLPWFEIFCGLMLMGRVAVRGTALLVGLMLVSFTALIFLRAWGMHQTGGMPFCEIQFDCGCGAGEVLICPKLVENTSLAFLAVALIFWKGKREAAVPGE